MLPTPRVAVLAVVVAVAGLAGCTTPAPAAPTATRSSPGPATEAPPAGAGAIPDPAAAVEVMPGQRGDCPIDPADPELITFVVNAADRSPVKVTYPVFRTDGQRTVRRMTAAGPVITVVLAPPCADGGAPSLHFTAQSTTGSALGCALFEAGAVLASADATDGGVADCSPTTIG